MRKFLFLLVILSACAAQHDDEEDLCQRVVEAQMEMVDRCGLSSAKPGGFVRLWPDCSSATVDEGEDGEECLTDLASSCSEELPPSCLIFSSYEK